MCAFTLELFESPANRLCDLNIKTASDLYDSAKGLPMAMFRLGVCTLEGTILGLSENHGLMA